jgi:outer membrane translocation and assembly module TamA
VHPESVSRETLQATSRRQIKSFSVQQFFKNAAEVWASSPHLRSKLKLHRETKQKSKRKSEESQLPLKSKGCNEIQGFRGNCDSLGKLGMCPSLAEPVSSGFPRSNFQNVSRETLQATSRRRIKSFSVQQFFKNAAEVWASSPHLRSKLKLHRETKQKSKRKSEESQLPLKSKGCNEIQGFRGNCDSQASWGCAPALPNRIQVVSLEAI